ncbi:MAG: Flp pilus assembly complex ATPase component TadA [Deltaproteobacteria bacterium]|nr:Flp pilus assembly complex ATPase component TadA [Deltaproteobacteria bacterium]
MFTVTIQEKGGAPSVREFDQPEVTIGRIQGNDIVLPKSNISKRHARIINNSGAFVVIDSKSTNGTYINGKRIDAPYDLRVGDKIFIGDFTIELEAAAAAAKSAKASKLASPPPPPEPKEPLMPAKAGGKKEEILKDEEWDASSALGKEWADDWAEEKEEEGTAAEESDPSGRAPAVEQPVKLLRDVEDEEELEPQGAPVGDMVPTRIPKAMPRPEPRPEPRAEAAVEVPHKKRPPSKPNEALGDEFAGALRQVHERLLRSMDLRRSNLDRMGDAELRDHTREAVAEIVAAMRKEGVLPANVDAHRLTDRVLDEALGLGPLDALLADDTVTEILVNGAQQIYVERQGKLEKTDRTFSNDQAVLGVIERIVAPIGRRVDESSPMVDARLKDGSRVNAIIPPLAIKGPTISIRKFTREPLQVDDLVGSGTFTADMAEFLESCVKARRNILISGGTGSGKTTMLNILSSYIPEAERIITIEDAAELKLDQDHVVSLEARPPNIEGKGAITIRELVKNALRMRPDRIVVGECRGGEALDMLQAMNTGHEGSLTTVHANGPRDALSRLETMVLMSGMELPVRAIRDQIANAINVVVQTTRLADGSRRVTHISEITGMEGEVISMAEIFTFNQEGFDARGRVQGKHRPTGFIPKFYETLKARGMRANMAIFQER